MTRAALAALLLMAAVTPMAVGAEKVKRKPETAAALASTRASLNGRDSRYQALGFAPYRAQIVVRIDRPAEDWYCPEVIVEWTGGQTRAIRESDCEPWPEIEPKWIFVSEEIVGWLGPGLHDILVKVKQGVERREFHLSLSLN